MVNSRLLVVKFWGVKSYNMDFQVEEGTGVDAGRDQAAQFSRKMMVAWLTVMAE